MNLARLETQLANISPRRITGIGRSARLATLPMAAGALSVHYRYIRSCALTLGRALRAYNSTICVRFIAWLRRVYSMDDWQRPPTRVYPKEDLIPFIGLVGDGCERIPETWYENLLGAAPQLPRNFWVDNTYHTSLANAPGQDPEEMYAFAYQGAANWYEGGLQV